MIWDISREYLLRNFFFGFTFSRPAPPLTEWVAAEPREDERKWKKCGEMHEHVQGGVRTANIQKRLFLKSYSLKKYEQQIGANVCADSVDEIQVSWCHRAAVWAVRRVAGEWHQISAWSESGIQQYSWKLLFSIWSRRNRSQALDTQNNLAYTGQVNEQGSLYWQAERK